MNWSSIGLIQSFQLPIICNWKAADLAMKTTGIGTSLYDNLWSKMKNNHLKLAMSPPSTMLRF